MFFSLLSCRRHVFRSNLSPPRGPGSTADKGTSLWSKGSRSARKDSAAIAVPLSAQFARLTTAGGVVRFQWEAAIPTVQAKLAPLKAFFLGLEEEHADDTIDDLLVRTNTKPGITKEYNSLYKG